MSQDNQRANDFEALLLAYQTRQARQQTAAVDPMDASLATALIDFGEKLNPNSLFALNLGKHLAAIASTTVVPKRESISRQNSRPSRRRFQPLRRHVQSLWIISSVLAAVLVGLVLSSQGAAIVGNFRSAANLFSGQVPLSPTPLAASGSTDVESDLTGLLVNPDFEQGLTNWFADLSGNTTPDFGIGTDSTVVHNGRSSGYLHSIAAAPKTIGALTQALILDDVRGKRIRLSAWIKTEDVQDWAGLYVSALDPSSGPTIYDGMQMRPIRGTTNWTPYEVVIDVPEKSPRVDIGVQLAYTGKVWLDDVRLEVVTKSVSVTLWVEPRQPINLQFDTNREGWFLSGVRPSAYEVGIDQTIFHSSPASGYLRSRPVASSTDWGVLGQVFNADDYRGKRIRLSAFIKTELQGGEASLWLAVDGPASANGTKEVIVNSSNHLLGTADWSSYDRVVDVPLASTSVRIGVWLKGTGRIWVDDVQVETVSPGTPLSPPDATSAIGAVSSDVPMSCPITRPPNPPFVPPAPWPAKPVGGEFWTGTADLWTAVGPSGTWKALPHNPAGYTQKIFVWKPVYNPQSEPLPKLTIMGQRLDAAMPPYVTSGGTNACHQDFGGCVMLLGIDLPSLGCWKLTVEHADHVLSFVVWVAP